MIPGTTLATFMHWISIEVALALVWATVLLSIVVGVAEYVKSPEAYNR
jgi:hypothetical protein